MEDKKQKRIRIIGLITLTILVVVGVILAIYFTQKKDNESQIEYINTEIKKVVEQDDYDFKVYDFKTTLDGQEEGSAYVSVYLTITAKKDINIALSDFSLGNYAIKSQNGFKNELKEGESLSFELNYVVKSNQELLYLIYKNIKVALGQVQI
ncbi:MAG: hypothetical protein K5923_04925 [Clostridia bacterium]|nr:hypothetical protein [Clostridia bacterium]